MAGNVTFSPSLNFIEHNTGNNNTIMGFNSASNLVNQESYNIYYGSNIPGVANENGTIRLGAATGTGADQINDTYIAGIAGRSVVGSAVFVSSANKLGVLLSSRNYKHGIANMDDYSSAILALRPVTFFYNDNPEQGMQVGLIAEEVAETFPALAVVDNCGNATTVRYHDLVPMLLNELQKALKRIDALEESALSPQELGGISYD